MEKNIMRYGTRLCLGLILVTVIIMMLAPKGFAADVKASGTCGKNASWVLTKDGTMTISGTGEMEDYFTEMYMGDDLYRYFWMDTEKYPPWYDYLSDIRTVIINKGITKVSHGSFTFCNNLQEVTLPEGLKEINASAFEWCGNLKQISLPSSLEKIGFEAFDYDIALQTITIPRNVEVINGNPFEYCTALQSIQVDPANQEFASLGGVLFSKDHKRLISYPGGKTGAYTIPDSVSYVERGSAFTGCAGLTKLTIPDSVIIQDESYGFVSLCDCTGLKEVKLPNYLTEIGQDMFKGCSSLETVNIPESVVLIGQNAFEDCTSLKQLTLPEGLTTIEDWAFVNCKSLEHMNLPSTLTSIGNLAFSNCSSWCDPVVVPSGVRSLPEWAFQNCTKIPSVTLPEGLTDIDLWAFAHCSSLAYVKLPSSLRSMGENVFYECKSLTSVFLPSGLKTIPEWAFGNCSNLQIIGIPKSVTGIGDYATGGCWELGTVYYEGSSNDWKKIKFDGMNEIKYCEDIHYGSNLKELSASYAPVAGFGDVFVRNYYADAVKWAVEQGVTKGTSAGLFSPENECTRGQVVTFLWRAAGQPEPASASCPFLDVDKKVYYYKAVLWAVEQNITSGISAKYFAPNETCTRGQVVTFLHRYEKSPSPGQISNPFKDVKTRDNFYKPVLWAVNHGVTKGVSSDHFAPEYDCTRGQIVTFLYRTLVN